MNYIDFSTRIKKKYPQYGGMDDRELAQRIVAKYPQYDVSFEEEATAQETQPGVYRPPQVYFPKDVSMPTYTDPGISEFIEPTEIKPARVTAKTPFKGLSESVAQSTAALTQVVASSLAGDVQGANDDMDENQRAMYDKGKRLVESNKENLTNDEKIYKQYYQSRENAKKIQDYTNEQSRFLTNVAEQLRGEDKERQHELEDARYFLKKPEALLPQNWGKTLASAASVAAESGVQNVSALLPGAGSVIMVGTEQGSWINEAKEAGLDDTEIINQFSRAYGVASGVIERLGDEILMAPIKAILRGRAASKVSSKILSKTVSKEAKKAIYKKILPKLLGGAKGLLVGAISEGLEEFTQDEISDLMLYAAFTQASEKYPEKAEHYLKLRENVDLSPLSKKRIEAAYYGAVAGGFTRGTTQSVAKGYDLTSRVAGKIGEKINQRKEGSFDVQIPKEEGEVVSEFVRPDTKPDIDFEFKPEEPEVKAEQKTKPEDVPPEGGTQTLADKGITEQQFFELPDEERHKVFRDLSEEEQDYLLQWDGETEREIAETIDRIKRSAEEQKEIDKIETEPSEAQKKAGNYPKAHIKRDGLDISIENAAGSERSGKDETGKEWKQTINHDYGYVKGTKGPDKDHVDVFIKPGSSEGGTVYVVNQVNPNTQKFDEPKCMMGFESEAEAKEAYLSNYEENWQGLGSITPMSMDVFKKWVYSKDAKKKSPVTVADLKKYEQVKPEPKKESTAKKTETIQKEGFEQPSPEYSEDIVPKEDVPVIQIRKDEDKKLQQKMPGQGRKDMENRLGNIIGYSIIVSDEKNLKESGTKEPLSQRDKRRERSYEDGKAVAKKLIEEIEGRNYAELVDRLSVLENKGSRAAFTAYTGIKLPKTVSGTKSVIRTFVGKDVYNKHLESIKKKKEEAAQKQKQKAIEERNERLKEEKVTDNGRLTNNFDLIHRLVEDEGYTRLEEEKKGIATHYLIHNDEKERYYRFRKKDHGDLIKELLEKQFGEVEITPPGVKVATKKDLDHLFGKDLKPEEKEKGTNKPADQNVVSLKQEEFNAKENTKENQADTKAIKETGRSVRTVTSTRGGSHPRRPAAVKRSQPDESYSVEYWQAQHLHNLNVSLYNALRFGWKDRKGKSHPGMQPGWINDYNILTDSNILGGRRGKNLSSNAQSYLQDLVDSFNESPEYLAELASLGLEQPEHIDDIRMWLEQSLSASEFVEYHKGYEADLVPQTDMNKFNEALEVFQEDHTKLTPEQRRVLEDSWQMDLDDVIARENALQEQSGSAIDEMWGEEKAEDLFEGTELAGPVTRSETKKKPQYETGDLFEGTALQETELGKELVRRREKKDKIKERGAEGLPLFETPDESNQTSLFEQGKEKKAKPAKPEGEKKLTTKELAKKRFLERQAERKAKEKTPEERIALEKEKQAEAILRAQDALKRLGESFGKRDPNTLYSIGTEQAEIAFEAVSALVEAGYREFKILAIKVSELAKDYIGIKGFRDAIEDAYDSYSDVDSSIPKRDIAIDNVLEEVKKDGLEGKGKGSLEAASSKDVPAAKKREEVGGDVDKDVTTSKRRDRGSGRKWDESTRGTRDDSPEVHLPETGDRRTDTRGELGVPPGVTVNGGRTDGFHNFHITDSDNIGAGGDKTKYQNNVAAIKVLKKIESENRKATPEEQQILVKYVGWGGMPGVFQKDHKKWTLEYSELKELLTTQEYEAARASTINAHYTSPKVIRTMWQVLERLGFKGGAVFEPGCGLGHFFGLRPNLNMTYTGIEMDRLTASIAQQLYQTSDIRNKPFEEHSLIRNTYNAAIGNVPFSGSVRPFDKEAKRYGMKPGKYALHDFFFLKTLYGIKPGGVVGFVTSRFTMDKANSEVRQKIAESADFVGAIRLPSEAFKGNANTEVVTDIIFLQKRHSGQKRSSLTEDFIKADPKTFEKIKESGTKIEHINRYFLKNPEMVLGEQNLSGSMYGPDQYNVVMGKGDIGNLLSAAIENFPKDIVNIIEDNTATMEQSTAKVFAPENITDGSFYMEKGVVYQKQGERGIPPKVPRATLDRIKGMIPIKDSVKRLLKKQFETDSDEDLKPYFKALNAAYDNFVKKNGYLHQRGNVMAMEDDVDAALLLSLENWDRVEKTATKADIFSKRTFWKETSIQSAGSPREAMLISLSERGTVDWDWMSKLTGLDIPVIREQLLDEGMIFKDPEEFLRDGTDLFIERESYLTGNVRWKLQKAKEAAEKDSSFQRNVKVLEEIIPKDVDASQIYIRLNSPVLIEDDIAEFVSQSFDVSKKNVLVRHQRDLGKYYIKVGDIPRGNVKITETYGTSDYNAIELVKSLLNNKQIEVERTDPETKKKYIDREASEIAKSKADEIIKLFNDWIWKDADRAKRIIRDYNDRYNAIVNRKYTHPLRVMDPNAKVTFPGCTYTMRPHQADAIWRVVASKNVMLAHAVGAGKTLEMICGGMELKRLGLRRKPMYVVPNHMVEQWAGDFRRAYPGAKVLVATDKNFKPAQRKEFLNRIATGDWDAVIVKMSHFLRIPVSQELERAYIDDKKAVYIKALENAEKEKDRISIKDLEARIQSYDAKIKKILDSPKDRGVIPFEQLGVDQLFVDEVDSYKNVDFFTRRNVLGLGKKEGTEKTADLMMKVKHIQKSGGGLVGGTGTPISNSMAEAYHMMRYFQPEVLTELNIENFDEWANQFAQEVTSWEINNSGSGYKLRTRFSKFVNIPELMSLLREAWDIQTSRMLENSGILVKGKNLPLVKYKTISVPSTNTLKSFIKYLSEEEERATKETGGVLPIIGKGKKAAVDMRLISATIEDNPSYKLNQAANLVYTLYKKYPGKTGMIFYDLTRPDPSRPFDPHGELKNKLVDLGVKEDEIAFIHHYNTDTKKLDLFDMVNSGRKRILIGSTEKMGAGTNAQRLLKWEVHIDCPWRPRDIEQREGRIIRQGNTNEEVEIYRLVTKGSYDVALWSLLDIKAKVIEQIMSGEDKTSREIEDDGAFSNVMMMAVDNPLVKESMELDQEVKKLTALRKNWVSNTTTARLEMNDIPKRIAHQQKLINGIKEDLRRAGPKPDKFSITIHGKKITDRTEAGELILKEANRLISRTPGRISTGENIGIYAGFPFSVEAERVVNMTEDGPKFTTGGRIILEGTEQVYGAYIHPTPHMSAMAMTAKIWDKRSGLEQVIKSREEEVTSLEKKLDEYKKVVTKKFEHEDRLKQAEARLKEVLAKLRVEDEKKKAEDLDVKDEYNWAELTKKERPEDKTTKEVVLQGTPVLEGQEFEIAEPNNYYAYRSGMFELMREAKPVKYKGVEGDFFMYKDPNDGDMLVVEARSGLQFANAKTIKAAISKGKEVINFHGIDKMNELSKDNVKRSGISPRYRVKGEAGVSESPSFAKSDQVTKWPVDTSGKKVDPTQLEEYDFDEPLTHESGSDFDGIINKEGIFNGVFTLGGLKGSALGSGGYHHTYIPRKDSVAREGSIDLDEERALDFIKNEYPDATQEQLEVIEAVAVRDKPLLDVVEDEYGEEDVVGFFNNLIYGDNAGEIEWVLQGLRGQIALDQGFDAIAMRDENGTSYLIPVGSKALYLGKVNSYDDLEKIKNSAESAKGASFAKSDQTKTKEFKKWFGDWENDPDNASKVVDKRGNPLVVYHGSPDARFLKDEAVFKSQKERYGMGHERGAHWFASSQKTARTYSDPWRAFDYQKAEPRVIGAYLNMRNPLVIDGHGKGWREVQKLGKTSNVIELAQSEGHDGIIIRNVKDNYTNTAKTVPTDTYMVFDSNQIKSATENIGTFDPQNPDIRYAQGSPSEVTLIDEPVTSGQTSYSSATEERLTTSIFRSEGKDPIPGSIRVVEDVGKGVQKDVTAFVEDVTGKKVVWVECDTGTLVDSLGFSIDGVSFPKSIHPDLANKIFIDVNTTRPVLWTAFHEFSHFLENSPEFKKKFWQVAKLTDSGLAQRAKMGDSEFSADIVGEMMSRPEFWENLRNYDRNLFDKAIKKIIEILSRLSRSLKRMLTGNEITEESRPAFERFIENSTELRNELAKALIDYNKAKGENVKETSNRLAAAVKSFSNKGTGQPLFAKKKPKEEFTERVSEAEKLERMTQKLRGKLRHLPKDQLKERAQIELSIQSAQAQELWHIKNAIYDYAKRIGLKGVPYNKVDTLLKNTETVSQLKKVSETLDDVWNSHVKRSAVEKLLNVIEKEYTRLKAIRGKRVSTIDRDKNRELEAYLAGLMAEPDPEAMARLNDTMEYFLSYAPKEIRKNPNWREQFKGKNLSEKHLAEITEWIEGRGTFPVFLSKDIQKAFRSNIYAMDTEQIERTIKDIEEIKKEGRTARKEKIARETMVREANISSIVSSMGHEEDMRPQNLKNKDRRERKRIAEGIKRFGDNVLFENLRIERILNWLDGNNGLLWKSVFEPILKAEENEKVNLEKALAKFEEFHKKIDTKEALSEVIGEIEVSYEVEPGKFKSEKMKITADHGMFIYANSQNPGNLEHLEGTGYTKEHIAQITEALPEKYKNAVDDLITYFDEEQYPRTNVHFAEEHEVDMPKVHRYFPVRNLASERSANAAATSDILMRYGLNRASVKKGHTKTRVMSKAPFGNESYFETALQSIIDAEHYIAFNTPVREVSRYIYDPRIKDAIKEKSSAAYREIRKWIRDSSHGRIAPPETSLDNVANYIRNNYAVAVLGANLITIMKQPASFSQGLHHIKKKKYAVKAAVDFLVETLKMASKVRNIKDLNNLENSLGKKVQEKSVMMRYRPKSVERYYAEQLEKGRFKKTLKIEGGWEKLREVMMSGIQAADMATTTVLWWGRYTEVLNNTMDEYVAIQAADELIRTTQPMGGLIHLPGSFRDPSAFKRAFSMFMNQRNQNFNMLFETATQWQSHGWSENTQRIVFYILVPSVLMFAASTGGKLPWDDPEGWAEYLLDIITGGIMYYNTLASAATKGATNIIRSLRGKRKDRFFNDFSNPVIDVVQDFNSLLANPNNVGRWIETGGKLIGFPAVTQTKRAVKSFKSAVESKDPKKLVWSDYALGENSIYDAMAWRLHKATKPEEKKIYAKWYKSLSPKKQEQFKEYSVRWRKKNK